MPVVRGQNYRLHNSVHPVVASSVMDPVRPVVASSVIGAVHPVVASSVIGPVHPVVASSVMGPVHPVAGTDRYKIISQFMCTVHSTISTVRSHCV